MAPGKGQGCFAGCQWTSLAPDRGRWHQCPIQYKDLWYDGDLCSEVPKAQLESVNPIDDNPSSWLGQSEEGRHNTWLASAWKKSSWELSLIIVTGHLPDRPTIPTFSWRFVQKFSCLSTSWPKGKVQKKKETCFSSGGPPPPHRNETFFFCTFR